MKQTIRVSGGTNDEIRGTLEYLKELLECDGYHPTIVGNTLLADFTEGAD